MNKSTKSALGPLVDFVESDPRFAKERETYAFVRSIVDELRAMREQSGMTQTELAKQLGVTQGRISQIESGLVDHAPNLEMIQRYAGACGFRPNLMFEAAERRKVA